MCFLGKVKFDEFLSAYLGQDPGEIVDAHTGEIIGEHKGIWYHTVGQRKGIGKVLHPKATSKGPWYVVAKDPKERRIIASNKYDEEIFEQTRSEFCTIAKKKISLTNSAIKEKVLMTAKKNPKIFDFNAKEAEVKPKVKTVSKKLNSVFSFNQLKKSPRELAIIFQAELKKKIKK